MLSNWEVDWSFQTNSLELCDQIKNQVVEIFENFNLLNNDANIKSLEEKIKLLEDQNQSLKFKKDKYKKMVKDHRL